ncbi:MULTISPECIES: ADP-forming succinate--CoA ligase subunit beta [Acidithiobacillus]|jgi:succinyl-CoA synthetase beta subunit|uniref:Succinate--CoA ligase [ADP-forming] subunit beta n=2 Tax=Acidithiobacillus ferridurans TaxID=1232575 RepID=A0A8X8GC45_ACIFI|nr:MULTISPECIES: ADP-forming succinate--CoA ligase subunit beta [Acidithiobacillus]MBU2717210.1 ADP-forming succinate--CoA ligase subunit beta [Acidithiobacillus ferridurans]MBU2722223.1 ADP-forming succinate--CoA ligase subunit beta [Acidithiobacillus ferridurans]MBU2726074.1 ADP-forming succinate--CoA ligase subunit beta [Acidithiobacillus ferridurans]MBU2733826.1 ADP-forming succinate--CoA ligase subunit beta [Acidithiobacillus ferridurans]MBU2805476.1 ADP-forming succinate--CoA ligase subu
MNLHEYQAKRLLAEEGVPVPRAIPAFSVREAVNQARELGGPAWVVKAQVHAGGRGKAGGVRMVDSIAQVEKAAQELLGKPLVTAQTGPQGQHVAALLIEEPSRIARELYLALMVDRGQARITFLATREGGVDIEELAASRPEALHRVVVEPSTGFLPFQARQIGFRFGLDASQVQQLTRIMQGMYRLAQRLDALMVEINPLAITAEGRLLALDAKVVMDDNALYRHPESDELFDSTQQDGREITARQFGLNYISLEGNIGCMVNGAGLAMATMDLIKLHGGDPANFLDVGGGAAADKVNQAFKLILSDTRVKAILVNIFGGITRCDLLAEGIIQAAAEVGLHLPVVVRLEGTRKEEGMALLRGSGLSLITADGLADAAMKAVAAAQG